MHKSLIVFFCSLSSALLGQMSDSTILYHQWASILGIEVLDDNSSVVQGWNEDNDSDFFAFLNPEGHVVWEREVFDPRGFFPLENGKYFLLNKHGEVWILDKNGQNIERLPSFLPQARDPYVQRARMTNNFIIVCDVRDVQGRQYHGVSFFNRDDGSFLYREWAFDGLWSEPLYVELEDSILELVNLEGQWFCNRYSFEPKLVEQREINSDLFYVSDFAASDERLWLCGMNNSKAAVASLKLDLTDYKEHEITIEPVHESLYELWNIIEVKDGILHLVGESPKPRTFTGDNTIFFTLWDIEKDQMIDSLIRPMSGGVYIIEDSKIAGDAWVLSGAYAFTDVGFQPPAFVTKINLNRTTSTSSNGNQPISIYPNPVSGPITIKAHPSYFPMQLIDINGSRLKSLSTSGDYNLEDVPSGIYHLRSPISGDSFPLIKI